MNTGLVDAVVLGEVLARAIANPAVPNLDIYEALRRPAAEKVLGLAGFLTNMAVMRSSGRRAIRNLLLSVVNVLPPAKRKLQMNLSGLSRRASAAIVGQTVLAKVTS